MANSEEIVVTGIRQNTIVYEDRLSNLAPVWWSQANHSSGTGSLNLVEAQQIITDKDKVFKIDGLSFDLHIPELVWNLYPANLKEAINYIVKNWTNLPTIKEAFLFLDQKGLGHVNFVIGVGTHQNSVFEIDYSSAAGNADRTEVVSGSTATILLNENVFNDPSTVNTLVKSWVQMLGHEFWHPKAPDNGPVGSDHPLIEEKQRMIGEEFDRATTGRPDTSNDNGKAVLGSSAGDQITGAGRNDVLSGMAGNDVISGGAGSNAMYGGLGSDQLISSGSADLLAGGAQGDTYIIQVAAISAVIREENGFDIIELTRDINDYQFFRYGNNLEISGNNGTVGTFFLVENFFTGGEYSTIERFAFGETEYAASYIEYLANGGSNMCYDASGSPIMCSNYGMPIVIDLNGNGIQFLDSQVSGVEIDVNGDGVADRVSWISGSDAFLIIDRNSNGVFDGYEELSFVNDMRGAGSDLEGLMGHDTNRDGFITTDDVSFELLKVWKDTNENGVSETDEIFSLEHFEIYQIDLQIFDRKKLDKSSQDSQIIGRGEMLSDQGKIGIFDVALAYQPSENCGCGSFRAADANNFSWRTSDGSSLMENFV